MERATPDPRRLGVLFAALLGFLAAPPAMAQSPADSASLRWAVPTTMPGGALVAVASGNPYAPVETTFLIAMPGGYRIPPHFHPSEVRIGVRKGSVLVGMGDRLDRNRARALAVGDSAAIPAGTHHFWLASDRAVVTLTFIGPFTITYLRAVDAPQTKAFPVGY
jgi:quercetin dioxygenase-like cupin family protein